MIKTTWTEIESPKNKPDQIEFTEMDNYSHSYGKCKECKFYKALPKEECTHLENVQIFYENNVRKEYPVWDPYTKNHNGLCGLFVQKPRRKMNMNINIGEIL